MELKRIGVLSLAKVLGIVYFCLGIIGGVIYGGVILVVGATGAMGTGESLLVGLLALFGIPILYGGIGFVGGLLVAAIYNLVAAKVGGLELQLEPKSEPI